MAAMTAERAARFWAKVRRSADDECWMWTAATDRQGYGQFWNPARRTMDLAHRVAYELAYGDLPARPDGARGATGALVCHRCDVPGCVNPRHLFVGEQSDNMRDMEAKGRRRSPSGEHNPRARLTQDQVGEIRAAATGRYGERSALARQYGISTAQVSKILLGQSWM